jgi:hypothetical protein
MLAARKRPANDAMRISILVLLPWQQCGRAMCRAQQMWCSAAAGAAQIARFGAFPQAARLAR